MATITSARRSTAFLHEAYSGTSDSLCLHIPATAHTLKGFRDWVQSDEFPDKLRCTFLNGEIYLDMSKEELETHAIVKAEICRVLLYLVRILATGRFYLDGVLVTNKAARVSNNPDATFVSWTSLQNGLVRLTPGKGRLGGFMEIEGVPDWILEIVSGTSVRKDTVRLRRAYHKAGIGEYWLVDARGDAIQFQIFHWRKTGYVRAPNRDGWQRSRVYGREFRLVREKTRMELWEYTLEMQPQP